MGNWASKLTVLMFPQATIPSLVALQLIEIDMGYTSSYTNMFRITDRTPSVTHYVYIGVLTVKGRYILSNEYNYGFLYDSQNNERSFP
jgi:hypothetical protein